MIAPMHATIRQEVAERPSVLLAIHDWSTLGFGGHPSKTDRATLTPAHDVGYDLATVLILRGDDGAPIAPVLVSLTTADGVLSTRDDVPAADLCHIDQIRGDMQYVHDLGFGSTVVHVIDREADSVNPWRQWTADGHLALVRADDRKLLCQARTSLRALAEGWHRDGPRGCRGALVSAARHAARRRGRVVLHRPGRRNEGTKKVEIPGPPFPFRLSSPTSDLKSRSWLAGCC